MALDQNRFAQLQRISEMQGRQITPEEWVGVGGDPAQYNQLYGTSLTPNQTNVRGLDFAGFERAQADAAAKGQMITPEQWQGFGGPAQLYQYLYGNAPTAGKAYIPSEPIPSNTVKNEATGSPTATVDQALLDAAFGHGAGAAAGAADQLFTSQMPLLTVDPTLTDAEQRAVNNAETNAADIKRTTGEAVAGAQQAAQDAEKMDPRVLQVLDALWSEYQGARNVDPRIEQFLTDLKKKADLGLEAPELTAIREAGLEGIDNTMQGALRQVALRNGTNNVTGAAQGIGMDKALKDALQARRGLELDVLNKNIDYKDAAFRDWGAGVSALDAEKFKRAQDTLANYSSGANTANQNYWDARNTATGNWGNIVNNSATSNTNAAKNWWDTATAAGGIVDAKNLFNISQRENYALGRLGAQTGGAGFWSAEESRKAQEDYMQGMVEAAKKSAENGVPFSGGYEGTADSSDVWDWGPMAENNTNSNSSGVNNEGLAKDYKFTNFRSY